MAAFNAIGLKPICGIPDQREKPRKNFQIPTFLSANLSKSSISGRNEPNWRHNIQGGLVLLASSLSAKFASALTYEEALEQSVNTISGTDFDAASVVEIIVNNPVVVAGGVAVIAVPLILSLVLGGKSKPFGVESAKTAYAKLGDDPSTQLLDIRSSKEVREVGSPDIRGLKKKPVLIPYRGNDKPGFLKKLSLRFKEPENTTLFILDKFDGNSELVAELVTANGFKSAYAIRDGAEGTRGWVNSGLPWILPKKSLGLDFSGLTDAFSGSFDGDADALPLTLGVAAAAAGLGLLAFTEIETVLQVLGSAALVQLLSKKLLFAQDRKKTLQQIDEFLTTKVAPKELVSDIKQIGAALLPTVESNRALPAPPEAASGSAVAVAAADSTPATANAGPESQAEAAPESNATQPSPVINSTPSHRRALSPYPSYPDFKPPTSPCPSQP